jgi:hypothetical protein
MERCPIVGGYFIFVLRGDSDNKSGHFCQRISELALICYFSKQVVLRMTQNAGRSAGKRARPRRTAREDGLADVGLDEKQLSAQREGDKGKVKLAPKGRDGLPRVGHSVLVAFIFMIKRLLISVAGGGVLTWLTYMYIQIPSTGPRLIAIVFLIPMQMLATSITKDRNLGEIVYWSLLVVVYTAILFLVWWVIEGVLNESKGRKK